METIGQRLKKIRNSMNLTTTDIKNKTGISAGNYSEWERDIKIPNGKSLIVLKEVFNVSIDWILTGEEINLSKNEKKIIEKFRQLSEYYQNVADYKIGELIKEQDKEESEKFRNAN